ncbi:tRNA (cytosine(38)-C(5))-methyltransferase isoform X3 [Gracilinanus agilis]|uniref:tRNA (cytosine(38)-C(5))-methyltransferase isoform X3 n=1 Tax=Gracilinanus agilis TaxID=191870 RepID=UPI001CFD4416|nr:tRNA (cytosine(38)-C(5))-methyltransferase isoform X3 [Gracilinanus agilis]
MEPLRVLELYSGIGGMHQALKESCVSAEVVAAVDVNTIANEVYKHNFPHTQLWAKTIEGITLKEFNQLSFNMILMSPPCQPFTRDRFVQTLENCGFKYQEFLLSPVSLGIPNSRLRYFLIAKLQSEPLPFQVPGQVLLEIPTADSANSQKQPATIDLGRNSEGRKIEPNLPHDSDTQCSGKETFLFKLETAEELERKLQQDSDLSVQMLKDFLEDDSDMSQYFLPPKALLRYALLLDIVQPTCRRSTYGSYIEGTGSVLQTAEDIQIEDAYAALDTLSEEEKLARLSRLKLRYFSPREIANLHGFPPEFEFPEKITVKQCYRLLGNSLNVHIVSKLIRILLG